jgi:hypothetical protein
MFTTPLWEIEFICVMDTQLLTKLTEFPYCIKVMSPMVVRFGIDRAAHQYSMIFLRRRPGTLRPLSIKLMCRCETPASSDKAVNSSSNTPARFDD